MVGLAECQVGGGGKPYWRQRPLSLQNHDLDEEFAWEKMFMACLAKGHRANPAASLRVETVFAAPVLLSGLACLVLSRKEEKMLEQRYEVHLQRLIHLHYAIPAAVVYFLAGCLLLPALMQLRMFSLFGQLCREMGTTSWLDMP